jgi:hypothetical protein
MSIYPSKEELERVWHEEQPGWLKNHAKETKGKQPYTLVAKPYRRVPLDPIELTVYAKNSSKALKDNSWKVSNAVQAAYPYKENPDIGWTTELKK